MIRKAIIIFNVLALIFFSSCKEDVSYEIANYNKKSETLKINYGRLDNSGELQNDIYKVINGDNIVIEYKRSGTTFVDASDFEAKYYEYLVFQVDSNANKFNLCDSSLSQIDCKYYWVCYSKKKQRKVFNIEKGCVEGCVINDSLKLEINVEVDFGFGGILERKKNRKIRFNKVVRLPASSESQINFVN